MQISREHRMVTRIQILLLTLFLACHITFNSHANNLKTKDDFTAVNWQDIYTQMNVNHKSIPQTIAVFEQNYLKASNVDSGDRDGNGDEFGTSIAIDGDTLVVGAKFEDGNNDDTLSSGAAYVFVKSNNIWVEQAYLTASNAINDSQFGIAVGISGNTIVVGSHKEDTTATDSGAVYVFTRSSNIWTEQTILKASNPGLNDNFGSSVDIDGDTIVAGAYLEDGADDGNEDDAGAAYVFVGSGNSWTQQEYLQADNLENGDNFGVSVSISNDTIVVGANSENGDDSGLQDDSGAAYVFTRAVTSWTQQDYLSASNAQDKDNFGISVAISADTIVVGAHLEDGLDNGSQDSSGAAYVFTRSGNFWNEQVKLKSDNTTASDLFGNSVAIDGDNIIVGAPNEGGDEGAAYLFTPDQNTWIQQSHLKASNSDAMDLFGLDVAISGNNLASSAPGEDSAFINNPNDNTFDAIGAGAVYVYSSLEILFSNGFESIVISQ
jgi:hypothetical protein